MPRTFFRHKSNIHDMFQFDKTEPIIEEKKNKQKKETIKI